MYNSGENVILFCLR